MPSITKFKGATSNKWFFANSEFLQRTTSTTGNEWILQSVTSDFLRGAISATGNERILQPVTSDFWQRATSETSNEPILQQVMSNSLQRAILGTSHEWILQRVTSNGQIVVPKLYYVKKSYFNKMNEKSIADSKRLWKAVKPPFPTKADIKKQLCKEKNWS